MVSKSKIVQASGKRKEAVARAMIRAGKGIVRINSKPIDVFQNEIFRDKINEALVIAGKHVEGVDIIVSVKGGGTIGQADAVRLAIAKGLVTYYRDDKLKQAYLDYDRNLMVADSRRKEKRKPGRSRARAAAQKSKR